MLKTERSRACARLWTPAMRNEKLRQRLAEVNMPEEIFRVIEGRRAKQEMERKTRLLEIEASL